MPFGSRYRPAPVHGGLGDRFADRVEPARFPERLLRFRNQRAARSVGLDELSDDEWAAHFWRLQPLPGNLSAPLALRYHGHQFDVYNPELGDGRGFLLAQLRDERGRLLDLGTKGSGTTPYSRGGDGRLTLKGGVREVLATEQLEALGVDTSKSLSLFETGEALVRGDEPSPTRSSVLVRLSHSHVRIGTFQRLAREHDRASLVRLVEHCVQHYYPSAADDRDPARALFARVVAGVADLTASYLAAGFVHGVLNSDNVNVTAESFDYGPYRFLPHWDPGFTAAYFDYAGLYAFGRQPAAMQANLRRLADALALVSERVLLEQELSAFEPELDRRLAERWLRRLGLRSAGIDADQRAVTACTDALARLAVPPARLFFDWYGGELSAVRARTGPARAAWESRVFAPVRDAWSGHEPLDPLRLGSHYFERRDPCDLLVDEIEWIWEAIAERDDWQRFERKLERIAELRAATQTTESRVRS